MMIASALLAALLAADPAVHAAEGHSGHSRGADKAATGKKDAAREKRPAARYRTVSGKEIGKAAVCPVTGEKLVVAKDTISVSYKDRVYYFCCAGCDKSFMKDPEKYAVKGKAAAKKYVCPMGCAESDKPGKCPECGMKLVERKTEKKQEKAARRYVCPMGDYEGDEPGRCPECGMTLKEKT